MVGSAVETEDNSRAERERQVHIEAKMSQNLAFFLDGRAVFGWGALSFSDGGVVRKSFGVSEPEDMELSTNLAGYGSSQYYEMKIPLDALKKRRTRFVMLLGNVIEDMP